MSSARLSVLGIEKYLNLKNKTLFDFNVPEGIEIDILKNNILLKSADFECIYADADFLKSAIELWSKKYYRTFDKWITALNIEYNPLENYDRTEDWTDSSKDTGKISSEDKANTTNHNKAHTTNHNEAHTTNHNEGSTSTDKSAYNSDSYSPYDKVSSEADDNVSSKADDEVSSEADASVNSSSKSTSETEQSSEARRIGRAHGNIGVTTSQQMLQSELDIATWNIYEQITDLFLQEFCLMVY